MKSQINNNKDYSGLVTLGFIVSIITIIFSMGIIRNKCVSKGYELSAMASEIEQRRISLETVEVERASFVSREHLFPIAVKKGFVTMQEGKTFNVQ